MIPNSSIDFIKEVREKYSLKGYETRLLVEEDSNKYEFRMDKGGLSVVLRDGYYRGKPDRTKTDITSFDIIFNVDDFAFAKYISDYPLDEYGKHLNAAVDLIDCFFNKDFTLTLEKGFLFGTKHYLNIRCKDGKVEHLLGKKSAMAA